MSDAQVISAFLDDDTFDARALADALADPDGRELLLDLVALRQLMQADGAEVRASRRRLPPMRVALRAIAAVAAVLVALAGGYFAGVQRHDVTNVAAPPATRVVQPSGGWQNVQLGRVP